MAHLQMLQSPFSLALSMMTFRGPFQINLVWVMTLKESDMLLSILLHHSPPLLGASFHKQIVFLEFSVCGYFSINHNEILVIGY